MQDNREKRENKDANGVRVLKVTTLCVLKECTLGDKEEEQELKHPYTQDLGTYGVVCDSDDRTLKAV